MIKNNWFKALRVGSAAIVSRPGIFPVRARALLAEVMVRSQQPAVRTPRLMFTELKSRVGPEMLT